MDPDELVAVCLLKKEGRETKISIKGRRSMAERIADFQAAGTERASARSAATRSGVFSSTTESFCNQGFRSNPDA